MGVKFPTAYLEIGSALAGGATRPFSFSCWFDWVPAGTGCMMSMTASTGTFRNGFEMNLNTGVLQVQSWANSSADTCQSSNSINNAQFGPPNHAAGTYSTTVLNGCLNGVLCTHSTTGGPLSTVDRTNIGGSYSNTAVIDKWTQGHLWDACMWWPYLLTPREMQEIYLGRDPGTIAPQYLIARWPLNRDYKDIVHNNVLTNHGTFLDGQIFPINNSITIRRARGNDPVPQGGTIYNVSIAEAMALADTVSTADTVSASIAEAMALADTVSQVGVENVSIVEAMALTDTISDVLAGSTALNEAMNLRDTIDATGGNSPFPSAIIPSKTFKTNLGQLITRRKRRRGME